MKIAEIARVIEAVLFVSGDGVDRDEFKRIYDMSDKELNKCLDILREKYSGDSGIHLIQYKNKMQLSSNPELVENVAEILNPIRERSLTKAALETVAIVAYKQPITRTEMKRTYFKGELSSEIPIEFTNDFPTMGMFARSIGVSVSAVKAWAGVTEDGKYKHDRFASAYACVKEWAEGMMESGALSGKLDANMAKFVLSNDYGKKDSKTVETSLTGIDERTLAVIERVAKRVGNG